MSILRSLSRRAPLRRISYVQLGQGDRKVFFLHSLLRVIEPWIKYNKHYLIYTVIAALEKYLKCSRSSDYVSWCAREQEQLWLGRSITSRENWPNRFQHGYGQSRNCPME